MVSIRTIVTAPLLFVLGGCGLVEADSQRFERWAHGVAAIPVTSEALDLRPAVMTAEVMGLRPAVQSGPRSPMRIVVVEPEVLLEARANGSYSTGRTGPEPLAQVAVEQMVQDVRVVTTEAERTVRQTIQLGAFSSRGAAEAAWQRLSHHASLTAVTPRYEEIQREGRTLVRLRASVAAHQAQAACDAARAGRYCASTGVS